MEIFLHEFNFNYSRLSPDCRDLYYISRVSTFLKNYITPLLVALGLLSNVVAIITFHRTRLRHNSTIVYLTGLMCSDSVFLASVFLVWLSIRCPGLVLSGWWCLSTTYFTGISSFMSFWYTVSLSLDRYLILLFPTFFAKLSPITLQLLPRITVFGLATLGIVVYLNITLLFGVLHTPHGAMCLTLPDYDDVVQVLGKMDLFFNLVVPFATLVFTNVHSFVIFRRNSSRPPPLEATSSFVSRRARRLESDERLRHLRQPRSVFAADVEMTRMSMVLSAVSLVFILPGHLLRLSVTIATLDERFQVTERLFVWQQLLVFIWLVRPVLVYPSCLLTSPLLRQALQVAFTDNPEIRHPRRPSRLEIDNPITESVFSEPSLK